jgi:hypothetical protein
MISVLFGQKYGKAEPAIASIMLVSTVGMIAALRPSQLGMHFFIQRVSLVSATIGPEALEIVVGFENNFAY